MPGLRASCFPDRTRSRRHSLKLGFVTDRGRFGGQLLLEEIGFEINDLVRRFRVDFGAVSEFDLI